MVSHWIGAHATCGHARTQNQRQQCTQNMRSWERMAYLPFSVEIVVHVFHGDSAISRRIVFWDACSLSLYYGLIARFMAQYNSKLNTVTRTDR